MKYLLLDCEHGAHVSLARSLLLRVQVVQPGPGAPQATILCRKPLALLPRVRVTIGLNHKVSLLTLHFNKICSCLELKTFIITTAIFVIGNLLLDGTSGSGHST